MLRIPTADLERVVLIAMTETNGERDHTILILTGRTVHQRRQVGVRSRSGVCS